MNPPLELDVLGDIAGLTVFRISVLKVFVWCFYKESKGYLIEMKDNGF